MPATKRRTGRRRTEEAWPLIRDILSFLIGAFILIWQVVLEDAAQVALVTAGLVLLGVPAAGLTQRLADLLSGRGDRGSSSREEER